MRMMRAIGGTCFFLSAALASLIAPSAVRAGDSEWGAYLASECMTCHQRNGAKDGIPSIVGWKESRFIAAIRAFQFGIRRNPVMRSVATSLSDDEITVLACFFAALESGEEPQ